MRFVSAPAPDGWVERFGVDVLISYKTDAALERLKTELCLWALNVDFKFRRVFARFLPKTECRARSTRADPGQIRTPTWKARRWSEPCVTRSISAPDIRSGCLSISGKIAASFATWRRKRC